MLLNIVKYGVSEGIAKLAPFFTTLYVAKFLSPELFGRYSLVIVLFEIIFILISFNIQATTRIDFFKENHFNFCKIKQNHIVISFLFASVALLSLVFLDGENKLIVFFLIMSALLRTISVFALAIFQCSKKVNLYIWANIIFVFSLALSIFIFVNLGATFYSWAVSMVIASALQLLFVLKAFGLKSFKAYWPRDVTYKSLKIAFVPAFLFMPQAIGWWLKNGADRFLINNFLGTEVLGNYSLAFQLSSILIIFVATVNLALVPTVNESLKNKKIDVVIRMLFIMALSCVLFNVLLYYTTLEVLDLFYQESYPLAKEMTLYLCIANLFQAFNMIYINVLYYENEGGVVAKVIFFSFVCQLFVNFQLLYFFDKGVIDLIISSAVFNLLVLAILLLRTRRVIASYRGLYV